MVSFSVHLQARLVLVVIFGPVNIVLALFSWWKMGFLAFNVIGADKTLQCKSLILCVITVKVNTVQWLASGTYNKSSNYSTKKIIQDTTYNVRQESEFICTLMEKSAYILALTLERRCNYRTFTVLQETASIYREFSTRMHCG